MSIFQIYQEQKVPATVDEVWDFISSPKNLKKITPTYMGFEIISQNTVEKMYPGMIIAYKVSPILGLKMTWVTEITQVKENEYFVDEQRIGPYKMWHHEHKLTPIDGGVLMTDSVSYVLPFGILGKIAHRLFIKKQLNSIFVFRDQAVNQIFGKFKS